MSDCRRKRKPRGGGVAWRDGDRVRWLKTNDVKEIFTLSRKIDGELVIHFRVASVGGVCDELRHPFPVTNEVKLTAKGKGFAVLFQNGTWHDWKDAVIEQAQKGLTPPTGPMSDTRAAAWIVRHRGPKFLRSCGTSRWVYFSARTTRLYGHWHKLDGIMFSNMSWDHRAQTPAPAPKNVPKPYLFRTPPFFERKITGPRLRAQIPPTTIGAPDGHPCTARGPLNFNFRAAFS